MSTELQCLNHGDDCAGSVEYRMALSGTGISYPRCARHWADRLDLEEELRARYPDSPIPPADFDPGYAGESWDEEW